MTTTNITNYITDHPIGPRPLSQTSSAEEVYHHLVKTHLDPHINEQPGARALYEASYRSFLTSAI